MGLNGAARSACRCILLGTFVRVQSVEYGRCPHVLCEGQAVLPVGQSDVPRVSTVKVRLRLTTHTYTRLTTHARHARPAALLAGQSDLPQAVCHGSATPYRYPIDTSLSTVCAAPLHAPRRRWLQPLVPYPPLLSTPGVPPQYRPVSPAGMTGEL